MSRALFFVAAFLLLEPTAAASRAPGWMGIAVADLTPDQCRSFGVKRGVLVVDVEPGGPADRKDIEESSPRNWNAGWTRSREEWRSSNSVRCGACLAE